MKKKWWILLVVLVLAIGGGYLYMESFQQPAAIAMPKSGIEAGDKESNQDSNGFNNDANKVNILLLGSDSRGDEPGRTDAIMLISADYDTHKVDVISVPRDTRVELPGVGLTKITHANLVGESTQGTHEGTLMSAQAVSDLLGVPINYYAKIDFSGFVNIIDALGGVDIELPEPVDDDMRDIHLSAGKHHLDGDQSLRLVRARYGLKDGDFGRQRNQFIVLTAVAEQALSLKNIAKAPEMIKIAKADLLDTNMSDAEILALGWEFKGIKGQDAKYYQLPGQHLTAQDPLVGAPVYYWEPDNSEIKEIMAKIYAN